MPTSKAHFPVPEAPTRPPPTAAGKAFDIADLYAEGPVSDVAAREAGGSPAAFALGDPAGRAGLAALIRGAAARSRDLRVFVKADFDLPFKHVNDLLQLCREAGAGEAAVVTREEAPAGPGGA